MTYRPYVTWCRILATVEGCRCPRRMAAVGAAIRSVLGVPASADWREVRWALCLDRRPVDDLCASFTAVYVALSAPLRVPDRLEACGTRSARLRHLARGQTCAVCRVGVEPVAA